MVSIIETSTGFTHSSQEWTLELSLSKKTFKKCYLQMIRDQIMLHCYSVSTPDSPRGKINEFAETKKNKTNIDVSVVAFFLLFSFSLDQ